MKYRLKNQALQEALDKVTNGAFSELLVDVESLEIEVNGKTISLELEPFTEYDPNTWNEWPEAKAPEGVLMRVELLDQNGELVRKCAAFQKRSWYDPYFPGFPLTNVKRFRPWEDEE